MATPDFINLVLSVIEAEPDPVCVVVMGRMILLPPQLDQLILWQVFVLHEDARVGILLVKFALSHQ